MSYVPFRRTDGRGTRAFHELSRPSDSAYARRGSLALPRCETVGRSRLTRTRVASRDEMSKCVLLTCDRVGKSWNANGLVYTTLLMRAGSYAKRIAKTPVRSHKLHLRTRVAYRRIHFGTHAARWLRAPSPKLHATQPSPRGGSRRKAFTSRSRRRNVCPSALLADTSPIRLDEMPRFVLSTIKIGLGRP